MSNVSRKRFRKSPLEFDLPELIIQLVQSFLTSKEAARTTLISKSWQNAWLTRPNLDFDLADFCPSNYFYHKLDPKFMEFVEKTLQRYENSNLNIESFRLSMNIPVTLGLGNVTKLVHISLVHRALKLGPTSLTFDFECTSGFDIPDEVFRYERLLSLTAKGCRIDLNRDDELRCSRLRSLSLTDVWIESRDVIFRMISSFPLIENLSLCSVVVVGGFVVGDGLQTINCRRLTSLVLNHVTFLKTTLFLADLSSKYPSLKDLTLHIVEDLEEIIISSPTLERLHFDTVDSSTVRSVKLDIPNIRKLTFLCSVIPDELYVKSNSRGWESYVSVTNDRCPDASWFYRLSNFLNKLMFSRISLSLCVFSATTFDYEAGEIRGLPTPEIEKLDIYHLYLPTQSCYVLFDGLFRMCHPKMITQYMPRSIDLPEKNNIPFIGKMLLDARDEKVPTPAVNQFMYGLNDLKEARIQVFDEDLEDWRDEEESLDALPNYNYLYYSPTPEKYRHQKVRFRLYWKL